MDRNNFDFDKFGENSVGRSMTVPDQALSLREIMYRSMQGMSIPNIMMPEDKSQEDETFEDAFSPDIDFGDLYENSERLSYYMQRIEEERAKAKENPGDSDSDSKDSPVE